MQAFFVIVHAVFVIVQSNSIKVYTFCTSIRFFCNRARNICNDTSTFLVLKNTHTFVVVIMHAIFIKVHSGFCNAYACSATSNW